jgi:hypothetical protein
MPEDLLSQKVGRFRQPGRGVIQESNFSDEEAGGKRFDWLILWSTGPGLNRRILVLQTSALATSPPVLSAAAHPWRACSG